MTTHCRYCGEPVRPNTMFCPSCGQIISGDVAAGRGTQAPPPFHTTGARETGAVVAPQPSTPIQPVPLPQVPGRVRAASSVEAVPSSPAPVRSAQPAVRASEPGPRRHGTDVALRLPDGRELPVDRTYVIGRSPSSGSAAYGGEPVEVADPQRSVSRIHLIVSPAASGVAVVHDPGSANGTVVERSRSRLPLAKGESLDVIPGDRILLGDIAIDVV